jgi:hypothetical protein
MEAANHDSVVVRRPLFPKALDFGFYSPVTQEILPPEGD